MCRLDLGNRCEMVMTHKLRTIGLDVFSQKLKLIFSFHKALWFSTVFCNRQFDEISYWDQIMSGVSNLTLCFFCSNCKINSYVSNCPKYISRELNHLTVSDGQEK